MQNGHIVEMGDTEQIYSAPQEPYTKKLIAAIPRIDGRRGFAEGDTP